MSVIPTDKKSNPENADGACRQDNLNQTGVSDFIQVANVVVKRKECKRNDCEREKRAFEIFSGVFEKQKRNRYCEGEYLQSLRVKPRFVGTQRKNNHFCNKKNRYVNPKNLRESFNLIQRISHATSHISHSTSVHSCLGD